MRFVLRPWHVLFRRLSGWVYRRQTEVIESQDAQIRMLMERMGRKRLLLTGDQRQIHEVKALGRKTLHEVATIVTPDTPLRWHRRLLAEKWDYGARRRRVPGRPKVSGAVTRLVRPGIRPAN